MPARVGGAAPWIFAILTLPMSLFLLVSASQDALLIACGAASAALLVHAMRDQKPKNLLLVGLVIPLGLVAMARPPYGALAVVPLALSGVKWRRRIALASAILSMLLIWSIIVALRALSLVAKAGADPAAQLALLKNDPQLLVYATSAALARYAKGYLTEFVGVLGSLDVTLPVGYYLAAGVMLFLAATAAMAGTHGQRVSGGSLFAVAAGLLLSCAGIFAGMYVIWTAPGSDIVEGVQGRYFLPLAFFAPLLLPAVGDASAARLHKPITILLLAFPPVSLAVMLHAIMLQYRLG